METIYTKDLAKIIGVNRITINTWLCHWRVGKFESVDYENCYRPQKQVELNKQFYKNMCEFLKCKKNPKYLDNFEKKFSYLEM